MKAFFLGAGASCGTMRYSSTPVPVAERFGEALQVIDPTWDEKYPALVKVIDHLHLNQSNWGLEPVWTCIDYYAKLQEAIPTDRDWSGESRQLKKALLEVYGRRCDSAADRLPLSDSYTLGSLFQNELKDGDVLISFNYDTIAERLASNFGRQIQSVHAVGNERTIILAKPHGSASWTMDFSTCRVIAASESGGPLLDSLSPEDVDSDREPLLLGAVPIKSELIREVQALLRCRNGQSWIGVFNTIARQWRAVVEAIRDAAAVVIVGYSFPREDQYGRFLIQEGIRLRNSRPTIEFFELEDKASDRAKEIMDAFSGHVPRLIYRGEVLPPR